MNGIPVSVAPPTAEGRLYPRYQNSIGILTLSTNPPRPCPFGINIDGTLILDFDEGRVLAGVELVLPMSRWKGKASTSPPVGSAGNLLLTTARQTSAEYAWPITVSKNGQTGAARIAFGGGDYNRPITLSETCSALLLDDQLTGFWFTLGH
jgi:hypothetical protein